MPDIWKFRPDFTLQCNKWPCTYWLPTFTLSTPQTFVFAPIIETFCKVKGGATSTTTRGIESCTGGTITKVQITDVYVRGGHTETFLSTIGPVAITTSEFRFYPLPLLPSESLIMPVPRIVPEPLWITLPAEVNKCVDEWPLDRRFCVFPHDLPFVWNLPWECCLLDWCRPLFTTFPFPTEKPSECVFSWCDDWPWNSMRSPTPTTTDGPKITLPPECTFDWCKQYSTIPVPVPPPECSYFWCTGWPLCMDRACREKPTLPGPFPTAVPQCSKDCVRTVCCAE